MAFKLSSPISEVKNHYDIVVVGSGYGAGVASSRLSRAGQKVCVLERGREFMLGEFPDSELEATSEMQVNAGKKRLGRETALFNFHSSKDINVLVGCGLGGTSLINANVSIRPEPRVFEDEQWPEEIRQEFGKEGSRLEKGYARAMAMLRPMQQPTNVHVKKMEALKKSADHLGEPYKVLDINVNFEDQAVNHVGVPQSACTHCGDCVSGCNVGAKNTVQMNYLPDAKAHGAEIFTQVEVVFVEKKDNLWVVNYRLVDSGRDAFESPIMQMTAKKIILGAGTLGSTKILQRSVKEGLAVSKQLGKRFSGNGDVLAFGYNGDSQVNGVGIGDTPLDEEALPGPCITSVIDARNKENLDRGMIVEDAVIPGALNGILPAIFATASRLIGKDTADEDDQGVKQRWELESLLRGAYRGAVNHSQTFLVMSHDGSDGELTFDGEHQSIEWPGVGQREVFQHINDTLKKASEAHQATFIPNPLWNKLNNKDLVTVHPLGGCSMGNDASHGVVNAKGQVFTGEDETTVHEGLYVADGAIIPRSLGANPLLTISALAERIMDQMAEDNGWTIDDSFSHKPLPAPKPDTLGIEFTETMRGYFAKGEKTDNYEKAFKQGEKEDSAFEFTLTASSDNLDALLEKPDHKAKLYGSVEAPALSEDTLTATKGTFNLLVEDQNGVETRRMEYKMTLSSEEGQTFFFEGFKVIHDDPGLDLWSDTTTLYITVYEGKNSQGKCVGQGILHIKPMDFLRQMTTMRVTNAKSTGERLKGLSKFGYFFAGSLFDIYGGVLTKEHIFDPAKPPRKKRKLRMEAPEVHYFKTPTGANLKLTRYKGGSKGPVMIAHPFNSTSRLFTIDTIETNLTEYLYANGYDLWLLDYRTSIDLPYHQGQFDLDIVAEDDFPSAIKTVRANTGGKDVHIIAHCVGSISAQLAILKGMKGVASFVGMQVSIFPESPFQVMFKTNLRLPTLLYSMGIKGINAYTDLGDSFGNKLLNKALRVYGQLWGYSSNNAVYNRMTFLFGPIYEFGNVNLATQDTLHETLGSANFTTYKQLTKMLRKGRFVDAKGNDTYLEHVDRMNMPITLIQGKVNRVFNAENTVKAIDYLKEKNGGADYHHVMIDGYGHNDCIIGKNAVVDVYPHILAHLERYA